MTIKDLSKKYKIKEKHIKRLMRNYGFSVKKERDMQILDKAFMYNLTLLQNGQ